MSVQEQRTVSGDNTVGYKGSTLQIPEDRHRYHYVKAKVRVHEYPDGSLGVFHGPWKVAEYQCDGKLLDRETKKEAA